MCGIAGFLFHQADKNLLVSMISQLQHRGPDGYGYYLHNTSGVGLAHARLSIIDLSGGYQPIHNEDKTIWVTFNGEIFNYIELRELLEESGHTFYTQTDTEVLVHAYEEWGTKFPSYLNGQFAFTLWDESKQQALLVRDRVGIHPLFYAYRNDGIFFASEIKSLLSVPSLSRGLNPKEISNIMTFWSTSPGRTVFKDIYEVLPGHILVITRDDIHDVEYWDHSYYSNHSSSIPILLDSALQESVDLRLRSDVPVGAYLSGGLDSTMIAALVRKYHEGELRTFSIKFEDAMFDESEFQQAAIDHIGVKHTSFTCKKSDVADNFESVIFHTEKPILRTAPVPMFLLSKLVKQEGFKVVLTGEGADEVFGGYDIFREDYVRRMLLKGIDKERSQKYLLDLYPWMQDRIEKSVGYMKAFFTEFKDTSASWFSHEPRWRTTSKSHQFFTENLPVTTFSEFSYNFPELQYLTTPLHKAQYLEFKTLFANYLISSQGDRMLMANGVEGRFPFLDNNVMEIGNHSAVKYKLYVDENGIDEKHILKKLASDLIPMSIINRKKQPYMAPDAESFFIDGKVHEIVDHLSYDSLLRVGLFDPKKIEILIKKFQFGLNRRFSDNMTFIGALSTQILHSTFGENFTPKPPAELDRFLIQINR